MYFRKRDFLSLLILIFFAVLFLTSCPEIKNEKDEDATYTVSGTATFTSTLNNKTVYLKLTTYGADSTAPALYSTSATFINTSSTNYSVSGVKKGTYSGWAFIDMNGNASSTNSPDIGDYVTNSSLTIVVNSNCTADIPGSAWVIMAP
jgi:hypothetical protein